MKRIADVSVYGAVFQSAFYLHILLLRRLAFNLVIASKKRLTRSGKKKGGIVKKKKEERKKAHI